MGRVEGKVAFITGAARGQGRAHAVRLAQEGANVIGVDICEAVEGLPYPPATPEDLSETVRQVEALDRRIVAEKVDTRDETRLRDFVDRAVAELGSLDIAAANAGIILMPALLQDTGFQSWQTMIDVTLTGTWNTVRAAIPHMIAGERGGAIIITTSTASLQAVENIGPYITAKHGLVGLMRTLALELGPHSIRVNSIAPTAVETDLIMNDTFYRLFSPGVENPGKSDMAKVMQTLHALPVPWIQPIDIANALLFLASDEARYITGINLPVDAGFTQR